MNEQTKHFVEFIKTDSIFSTMTEKSICKFEIEFAFVTALFVESNKCGLIESEKNLMSNTACTIIEEHREDFDRYRKRINPNFYCQWRQQDCECMAREIVDYVKDSHLFKRLVEMRLYEFRDELFDEALFKQHFDGYLIEEHPLQTFVFWLDYIETLKGLPDYQNWFAIRRKLINLLRVGNAVFRRSEWQSKVSTM